MKNKFAFFIDGFFVAFISFILALVLFNFFTPHPYSIIYSLCISALSTTLYFARNDKRRKKQLAGKEEQKASEALISELNFSTKQEQSEIFTIALNKAGVKFERKQGAILITDKSALLISKFSFNKVGKSDIVKAFNLLDKGQTAYILSESFEPEVVSFAERFSGRVRLVSGNKVYAYLKKHGALPQTYKYQCFAEQKKKGSFKNLLDKKKAKTFFIFGTLFLLFSYISPLKVYYIVCGCLFLVYSLVLRLLGKDIKLNNEVTDNI